MENIEVEKGAKKLSKESKTREETGVHSDIFHLRKDKELRVLDTSLDNQKICNNVQSDKLVKDSSVQDLAANSSKLSERSEEYSNMSYKSQEGGVADSLSHSGFKSPSKSRHPDISLRNDAKVLSHDNRDSSPSQKVENGEGISGTDNSVDTEIGAKSSRTNIFASLKDTLNVRDNRDLSTDLGDRKILAFGLLCLLCLAFAVYKLSL